MKRNQNGFTIIELVVVILIAGILLTLVATTYSGVQAKNRNNQRQADINSLQSHLEAYYAQFTKYPTFAEFNDFKWRAANLKEVGTDALTDPSWNDKQSCTDTIKKAILSNTPKTKCYSYQVTGADGSACNNAAIICAQYTLTTKLEGGDKYTKSSPN
jgi:prepilin-type N-terminal cleavage/methylation domain-containing protein